jgi:hypothetical protein
LRRIGVLLAFCAALLGCSPDYNWRQVVVGDGAVVAFFPDRAITQSRELDFSGHRIVFSLTSATVDDATFTVAYAPLPDSLQQNDTERAAMGRAVIESLYRNLGVQVPDTLPSFGDSFTVQGETPQGNLTLQAAVWVTPTALVEGLVMAGTEGFPKEAAQEFIKGLTLAGKP